MTHLTEANLKITLTVARERPTWATIMAAIGAAESTAYLWLRQSKADSDAKLGKDSKFFIQFDGEWDYWAPGHLARCKKAFSEGFHRKIIDACANNLTETCFDPSSGLPIHARNPEFLHRSDEYMIERGFDPDFDRYQWERDEITDEVLRPLRPIYQTRTVQTSAQLKLGALRALMPRTWSERVQSDVQVNGQVVHVVAPPRFVPRAVREQQGDVVDASFTEVREGLPAPEARRDIAELQAAAARLSDPNRVTRPDPRHPVRMGDGTPINNRVADKPDHEDELPPAPRSVASDTPHPKVRLGNPKPQETPPSYARKATTDPHNPNARAAPAGSGRSITR